MKMLNAVENSRHHIEQKRIKRIEASQQELDKIKEEKKNLYNNERHKQRDKIEKLENYPKKLEIKENMEKLIKRSQERIHDLLHEDMSPFSEKEKLAIRDKIHTFILLAENGVKSLTSLYDKSKNALKMLKDFGQFSIDEIKTLCKLPYFSSLTNMQSGKGLPKNLEQVYQFKAGCDALNLEVESVATLWNRRGIPSITDLKFLADIKAACQGENIDFKSFCTFFQGKGKELSMKHIDEFISDTKKE